jgi:hypothetical protein
VALKQPCSASHPTGIHERSRYNVLRNPAEPADDGYRAGKHCKVTKQVMGEAWAVMVAMPPRETGLLTEEIGYPTEAGDGE